MTVLAMKPSDTMKMLAKDFVAVEGLGSASEAKAEPEHHGSNPGTHFLQVSSHIPAFPPSPGLADEGTLWSIKSAFVPLHTPRAGDRVRRQEQSSDTAGSGSRPKSPPAAASLSGGFWSAEQPCPGTSSDADECDDFDTASGGAFTPLYSRSFSGSPQFPKPSSASACDISPRDLHRESAVGWVSRSPSSPRQDHCACPVDEFDCEITAAKLLNAERVVWNSKAEWEFENNMTKVNSSQRDNRRAEEKQRMLRFFGRDQASMLDESLESHAAPSSKTPAESASSEAEWIEHDTSSNGLRSSRTTLPAFSITVPTETGLSMRREEVVNHEVSNTPQNDAKCPQEGWQSQQSTREVDSNTTPEDAAHEGSQDCDRSPLDPNPVPTLKRAIVAQIARRETYPDDVALQQRQQFLRRLDRITSKWTKEAGGVEGHGRCTNEAVRDVSCAIVEFCDSTLTQRVLLKLRARVFKHRGTEGQSESLPPDLDRWHRIWRSGRDGVVTDVMK